MKYRNILNSTDWDSILSNADINLCAKQFSGSIMQAASESIPATLSFLSQLTFFFMA